MKFFSRYFRKEGKSTELRQAFMLEAQHMLHPAFRNITLVHNVMTELVNSESIAVGGPWWKQAKKSARENALAASRGKSKGKGSNAPLNDAIYRQFLTKAKAEFLKQSFEKVETKVKQSIIDTIVDADPKHISKNVEEEEEFEDQFLRQASFTGCTSVEMDLNLEHGVETDFGSMPRSSTSKRTRVRNQFTEYLHAQRNIPAFSNVKLSLNLAQWTKEIGLFKYAMVVLAIPYFFGVPTSSSGIELDFYFESLLLTKRRMSMRGEVAEMLHMVDRNKSKVDLSQVCKNTIEFSGSGSIISEYFLG